MIENQKQYISNLQKVLSNFDLDKIFKLTQKLALLRGGGDALFLAGNGGSAATASHAACDLSKTIAKGSSRGIKAICLNDNTPLITAWANDTGYKNIFSGQLKNLGQKGDMLLVFSASGNSENILELIKAAKQMDIKTFAFLGFDGGKAKNMADDYLLVPINDFGIVEDAHMIIIHAITDSLKKNL